MHLAILIAGVILACFVSFCVGCATGWYARTRVAEILRAREELEPVTKE